MAIVNICTVIATGLVRQLIRWRLVDGRLPRHRTVELSHSRGFGQMCDGCGQIINTTDWMRLICADDWNVVRLHEDCFVLWEREKRTLPWTARGVCSFNASHAACCVARHGGA